MSKLIQFYLSNNPAKKTAHHDTLLQCTEFFIIEWQSTPNAQQIQRTENLLNATQLKELNPPYSFIIAPRQGTISAWSSKTCSLFSACQIEKIHRIERLWNYHCPHINDATKLATIAKPYVDKMTQQVLTDWQQCQKLFNQSAIKPLKKYDIATTEKLQAINEEMSLALSTTEITYLKKLYHKLDKEPTDAELMMFAQVNSEHCRHKIFNAQWQIDGQTMPHSLFAMIRNTYKQSPQGISTAYDDNAAVLTGGDSHLWQCDEATHHYQLKEIQSDIQIKVETHNHPTAISPYPGAATGSGGELRDEAATGRGGTPKAGLVGYSVSHLNIPERPLPFEDADLGKPEHISSSLDIMLQAPIGAARYNNEFGRPCINGYFRSYCRQINNTNYGYHKPIMLAGGLGSIMQNNVHKKPIKKWRFTYYSWCRRTTYWLRWWCYFQ